MTDEQIMKAKEHYKYGVSHDIFKEPVLSYAKTVLWAFEEINRQRAEVENWKRTADYNAQKYAELIKEMEGD